MPSSLGPGVHANKKGINVQELSFMYTGYTLLQAIESQGSHQKEAVSWNGDRGKVGVKMLVGIFDKLLTTTT